MPSENNAPPSGEKTSSPPTIEQIRAAVNEFVEVQQKYREFGAYDTEPDGIFQQLIDAAADGRNPAIPRTGAGWELYANSMDCTEAAIALACAALKVVTLIENVPLRDLPALKRFVKNYCWRVY